MKRSLILSVVVGVGALGLVVAMRRVAPYGLAPIIERLGGIVALPNGYLLAMVDSKVRIATPHGNEDLPGVAVPAEIVSLAVRKQIVCGRLVLAGGEESLWHLGEDPPTSGYFVLDTQNHSVRTGLSKDEWLRALTELGINQEPTLERPSGSFRYNE